MNGDSNIDLEPISVSIFSMKLGSTVELEVWREVDATFKFSYVCGFEFDLGLFSDSVIDKKSQQILFKYY